MFTNIGKKIKVLAQVFCWGGITVSVIISIFLITQYPIGPMVPLYIIVGGSLVSWISSFTLYGFGELIDQTQEINSKLNNTNS